jgi:hypothetical protein
MIVLGGQSDVEIRAQRSGHLIGEEFAQAPAGDPANDLTDQKAVGDLVVARSWSWWWTRRW